MNTPTGDDIPIEERSAEEITCGFGKRTVPEGVKVYNPAFDVVPHELITAIITDKGIIANPIIGNVNTWIIYCTNSPNEKEPKNFGGGSS